MRNKLHAIFRSLALAGSMGAVLSLTPVSAVANEYPDKPIEMIVASTAGGILDTIGRAAGRGIEKLGQPVVVKNMPGGGGTIGTSAVARAKGDGYTLGAIATSHGINPSIYENLSFDTKNDFSNVTQMVELTNFLVVHPDVPADNLEAFIALAKKSPGELTYGSAGIGQSNHLSGELLQQEADIELTHIPYKGSAQALTDVVGGELTGMFVDALSAEPFIQSGQLKLIAATGLERSESYPDYPTLNESGLPGFNGNTWLGIVAPAEVPQDIVDKLAQAVHDEFHDPQVHQQLLKQGVIPVASSPADFDAFVHSEIERWAEVIANADIEKN